MTFHHLSAELALVLRVLLRQPGFWVPTVLFPAMLYSFFGAGLAGQGPAAAYAMASFAVYAVLGVGFYQFGVTVAHCSCHFAKRQLPGLQLGANFRSLHETVLHPQMPVP